MMRDGDPTPRYMPREKRAAAGRTLVGVGGRSGLLDWWSGGSGSIVIAGGTDGDRVVQALDTGQTIGGSDGDNGTLERNRS